ncbi:MAG: hypothetical protein HGA96_07460 [Desulfobulbaceae bacterium]|nr:hypothetical protein [Desulfobulbaceae bacterium]
MNKIIALSACILLLPMAALATTKHQAAPSKAAIEACVGKAAGDAVKMAGKKKGAMLDANCQDVKGQLVAVPNPPAAKK